MLECGGEKLKAHSEKKESRGKKEISEEKEIFYGEVFSALNKSKIDYAVCGGTAVVLYGFPRLTVDLDIVISLEKKNLERIYNVLTDLNYKPIAPIKKEEFINEKRLKILGKEKNMKVVSFYNLNDPLKVIDIGVNLPKVPEILERKKWIEVENLNIPIILIDDLIKMKKDLARSQDLIDVENLKKIKKEKSY